MPVVAAPGLEEGAVLTRVIKKLRALGRGRERAGRRLFRKRFGATVVFLAAFVVFAAGPTLADDYKSRDAGFPLRIVAYAVYPAGVVLDYLIFRPAYWVGSHEPFRTVFGVGD